jgi:hypothetical protein
LARDFATGVAFFAAFFVVVLVVLVVFFDAVSVGIGRRVRRCAPTDAPHPSASSR